MPVIAHDKLQAFIARLLECAGASAEEAGIVARHSIAANLAGHDSHGVIQMPVYIDLIKRGHIVPGAPFEVTRETSTTLVVNGNWGFGYVVSERAMNMVIDKAKQHGVAAATVSRQSHVGRLADYPLMTSAQGLIGMMTVDSGRSPKTVAPFGGRLNRLGTNPICIAMPSNLEAPLYIDFSTSAVAFGKISVAAARNEPVPLGWILDRDGRPTTDPNDLANGGLQLPLGGSEGHKGYGLSVIVEILSGILTGLGFGHEPSAYAIDGCFMAAFDVSAFRPLDEFKQEVTEFAQYLKETPPAEGFTEVLYPGELEYRRTRQRTRDGISVEDATWNRLTALAREYGVSGP